MRTTRLALVAHVAAVVVPVAREPGPDAAAVVALELGLQNTRRVLSWKGKRHILRDIISNATTSRDQGSIQNLQLYFKYCYLTEKNNKSIYILYYCYLKDDVETDQINQTAYGYKSLNSEKVIGILGLYVGTFQTKFPSKFIFIYSLICLWSLFFYLPHCFHSPLFTVNKNRISYLFDSVYMTCTHILSGRFSVN